MKLGLHFVAVHLSLPSLQSQSRRSEPTVAEDPQARLPGLLRGAVEPSGNAQGPRTGGTRLGKGLGMESQKSNPCRHGRRRRRPSSPDAGAERRASRGVGMAIAASNTCNPTKTGVSSPKRSLFPWRPPSSLRVSEAETEAQAAQAAQAPAWRGTRASASEVIPKTHEKRRMRFLRGAASLSKTGRDLAWMATRSAQPGSARKGSLC